MSDEAPAAAPALLFRWRRSTGVFDKSPIFNFHQSDLHDDRACLLISSRGSFLWIGTYTSSRDKDTAFRSADDFLREHNFARDSPLHDVLSGSEPPEFTVQFGGGWDPDMKLGCAANSQRSPSKEARRAAKKKKQRELGDSRPDSALSLADSSLSLVSEAASGLASEAASNASDAITHRTPLPGVVPMPFALAEAISAASSTTVSPDVMRPPAAPQAAVVLPLASATMPTLYGQRPPSAAELTPPDVSLAAAPSEGGSSIGPSMSVASFGFGAQLGDLDTKIVLDKKREELDQMNELVVLMKEVAQLKAEQMDMLKQENDNLNGELRREREESASRSASRLALDGPESGTQSPRRSPSPQRMGSGSPNVLRAMGGKLRRVSDVTKATLAGAGLGTINEKPGRPSAAASHGHASTAADGAADGAAAGSSSTPGGTTADEEVAKVEEKLFNAAMVLPRAIGSLAKLPGKLVESSLQAAVNVGSTCVAERSPRRQMGFQSEREEATEAMVAKMRAQMAQQQQAAMEKAEEATQQAMVALQRAEQDREAAVAAAMEHEASMRRLRDEVEAKERRRQEQERHVEEARQRALAEEQRMRDVQRERAKVAAAATASAEDVADVADAKESGGLQPPTPKRTPEAEIRHRASSRSPERAMRSRSPRAAQPAPDAPVDEKSRRAPSGQPRTNDGEEGDDDKGLGV